MLVGDRPRADAADGGLHVLRLDRIDDVAGREAETGQPVGPDPGAHRVILRAPKRGVADAGRAFDLVEQIDGDIVGDETADRGVLLRGIDRDDAEKRGGLLLDRDTLALHFGRQARQRDLDPVVDVDRVDVGIGAELERGSQRVAAVIAAHALHIDHLVDADDLRLDRLRDRRIDHGGIGARKDGRDRNLRRHDIRILGNRDGR